MENKQDSLVSYIIINKINIEGNKKTKERIILRELDFLTGDTIWNRTLVEKITISRNRVFNTSLFVTVDFQLTGTDPIFKELLITVKERWYFYPLLIFDLADRNFNEWWHTRNHDPRRLEYGVFLIGKNMRGRNEYLKLKLTTGFSQKAEITYSFPYIDKKQTVGLSIHSNYNLHKQIAYRTSEHVLSFYEDPSFIRKKLNSGIAVTKRNKFYQTHLFGINFSYNSIGDTIAALNPDYFLDGRTSQRFFSLRYSFIHDRRDIMYYPLKGYYLRFEAEKHGIGIFKDVDVINFKLDYSIYRDLGKKIYLAAGMKNKYSHPSKQPYFLFRGLGYGNEVISGYELYALDGHSFSLTKVNLKRQLFSLKPKINLIPVKQFQTIPIDIYFKIHFDAGYVANSTYLPADNKFANEWLWGAGAGFDIVTFYDLVYRFEYSINKHMQSGFFFNMKAAI